MAIYEQLARELQAWTLELLETSERKQQRLKAAFAMTDQRFQEFLATPKWDLEVALEAALVLELNLAELYQHQ